MLNSSDNKYISVFHYDLVGAVIQQINRQPNRVEILVSTYRMDIPSTVRRVRTDGRCLISFINVTIFECEFKIDDAATIAMADEGNEILAYGFEDNDETADNAAMRVFFDTDWGTITIHSETVEVVV